MSVPVVILAGGLGTRLREETDVKPKPMVEVGGYPILWHIMKTYAAYGFDEFVICLGYKGNIIKRFFLDYRDSRGSLTLDLGADVVSRHRDDAPEAWKVHLLETGEETMTGGRIRRAARFLGPRRFMATYGDGVADVNISALLDQHHSSGKTATITAVRPPARFGGLSIAGSEVQEFIEKPQIGEGWINGGYMVFEPEIAEVIEGDASILEREPLELLADRRDLGAYQHEGFWQCMDTVRDLSLLRELWDGGAPPWKRWT